MVVEKPFGLRDNNFCCLYVVEKVVAQLIQELNRQTSNQTPVAMD